MLICSPAGWMGIAISLVSFLFFTDMCIYWIHRFLHHKRIYKVSGSPPVFERISTHC